MAIYAQRPVEESLPRYDRMYEAPSAKNAQGLFPPDACLFIGNLSTQVPLDKLSQDVQALFSTYGPCHVKTKQDRSKKLPGAFVQFERIQDAQAALAHRHCTQLHGRWLRVEKARGRRTARMSYRSGDPISIADVYQALANEGPVEAACVNLCVHPYRPMVISTVATVTFAFVDDFKDAVKRFQRSPVFCLAPTNIDGSPFTRSALGCSAQVWVPAPVAAAAMNIKPAAVDSGYSSRSVSQEPPNSDQKASHTSSSSSKPGPGDHGLDGEANNNDDCGAVDAEIEDQEDEDEDRYHRPVWPRRNAPRRSSSAPPRARASC